jgi:hypothetical protein
MRRMMKFKHMYVIMILMSIIFTLIFISAFFVDHKIFKLMGICSGLLLIVCLIILSILIMISFILKISKKLEK